MVANSFGILLCPSRVRCHASACASRSETNEAVFMGDEPDCAASALPLPGSL